MSTGAWNMNRKLTRRALLSGLASAGVLARFGGLLGTAAAGPLPGIAKRIIFFYFPDGVPEPDGAGKWHPAGQDTNFTLSDSLAPLAPYKNQCAFLRGLSLGPTDAGSHPGGAKKLLTGVDGGNGESIDRYLARTVGAALPVSHLYLGAMATQNNASGDKFISYVGPGTTVAPQDDPVAAFETLFGKGTTTTTGGGSNVDPADVSVLDTAFRDLEELQKASGDVDKAKLALHMEALRDVEKRIKGLGAVPTASCTNPALDASGVNRQNLFDPATFPAILRAQTDVMVQAMACGLTKVGVIQSSGHTSELIMSRFAGTPLYKPNFDMRSHQASHYGQTSDPKFADYVAERAWFVGQLAYLLEQLKARPEGAGTMLDNSIVVLCSEVCDGNTHGHDNMPFVVCGGGGGALRTGRIIDNGYRRHGELLVALGRAMGDGLSSFGSGSEPFAGLLA